MRLRLLAAAGVTGFILLTPAAANAQCCGQASLQPDSSNFVLQIDPIFPDPQLDLVDPQLTPQPPMRQATEVWFQRPVMVGRSILQGHYVIEHDNDRLARGEPCTHIYAFNDRTRPVVAFHCTHLERDRPSQNIAVIETKGDWQVFTEFQFAGEAASHGVPVR